MNGRCESPSELLKSIVSVNTLVINMLKAVLSSRNISTNNLYIPLVNLFLFFLYQIRCMGLQLVRVLGCFLLIFSFRFKIWHRVTKESVFFLLFLNLNICFSYTLWKKIYAKTIQKRSKNSMQKRSKNAMQKRSKNSMQKRSKNDPKPIQK